jgi:hypothetical protein
MEKLIEVSEAIRIALVGHEQLLTIIPSKNEAVKNQDFVLAANLREQELKAKSLIPTLADLAHWKEVIDKHIEKQK